MWGRHLVLDCSAGDREAVLFGLQRCEVVVSRVARLQLEAKVGPSETARV